MSAEKNIPTSIPSNAVVTSKALALRAMPDVQATLSVLEKRCALSEANISTAAVIVEGEFFLACLPEEFAPVLADIACTKPRVHNRLRLDPQRDDTCASWSAKLADGAIHTFSVPLLAFSLAVRKKEEESIFPHICIGLFAGDSAAFGEIFWGQSDEINAASTCMNSLNSRAHLLGALSYTPISPAENRPWFNTVWRDQSGEYLTALATIVLDASEVEGGFTSFTGRPGA